jgi:hypothetical protein
MVSDGPTMNEKFSDIVRRTFSFLEEAGFRRLHLSPTLLRYEAENVFVTITWDPRSGEIDELIGLQPRKGERGDGFSLSDLLAMEGADVPERKMPFQVADESRLGPFLEKLAEDTSTFARSALAGDRMYFRRLKTFRSAAAQAYMRSMTLQNVRSEAEKAWHRREFDRVVDLYTSIESDLSGSERGKLEYAKRKRTMNGE